MSHVAYSIRKVHWSVFSFFLIQGLCFASWASRIPDFKAIWASTDAFFWGWLLFLIPLGRFCALPVSGWLTTRWGSRVITQISVLGFAFVLFLSGIAGNIYLLAIGLYSLGFIWNFCDISLNAQGLLMERQAGRPLMAVFHGGWSLGACLGALIGFISILLNIAPVWHFLGVLLLTLCVVMGGRKYLQSDRQKQNLQETGTPKKSMLAYIRDPEPLLIQLGLGGMLTQLISSTMFDWSGVYFETVVQVPASLKIGFLIFMVMMTIGRFSTNRVYRSLGKQKTLQSAGLMIFSGFMLSSLVEGWLDSQLLKVLSVSAGFMLVGLGVSCLWPTIFSLVGTRSQTPTAIALMIVSGMGFIGALIAPPLVGAISDTLGMQAAYIAMGTFGLCIVWMASVCQVYKDA